MASEYNTLDLARLFYAETFWFLGPDRCQALTADNVSFKFKPDGAPVTITYHLPYDEQLVQELRQKNVLFFGLLAADSYSLRYPFRNRPCAVTKFVLTYDFTSPDVMHVCFTCCSFAHFKHFIVRVQNRS